MKKILILLYVWVVLSLNSYAEVKWDSVFFENFENGISENFAKNAVFFKEKVKIVDGKKSLSGAKSLEITGFGSKARHYLNLFKDGLEGGYFYKISFKYKVVKVVGNQPQNSVVCKLADGKRYGNMFFHVKYGMKNSDNGVFEDSVRIPKNKKATYLFSSLEGAKIIIDDIEILRTPANPVSEWLFEDDLFVGMKHTPTHNNFLTQSAPENNMTKEAFFPFIDKFGQYKHRQWKNKITKREDFKKRIDEEITFNKTLSALPKTDTFCGIVLDTPLNLKATGRFRTQKIDGKWWFITPEGNLFWSLGVNNINTIGMGSDTPISDREHYFETIRRDKLFVCPPAKHTYYKKGKVHFLNFHKMNLSYKYGKNHEEKYTALTLDRVKNWGVNTLGSWSEDNLVVKNKYPFTYLLRTKGAPFFGGQSNAKLVNLSEYWHPMKDFFDPEFEIQTRNHYQKHAHIIRSPYCIGIFSDNEYSWQKYTLLTAKRVLITPPTQYAKIEFQKLLQAKYVNIEALNKVWKSTYKDWEDFLNTTNFVPKAKSANPDLLAFEEKYYQRYFGVCKKIIKEISPDVLYLGCRFAWYNSLTEKVASRYCDVISYNLYRFDISDFALPKGAEDKPIIVGEFHFGNQDGGMFGGGLVVCKTMQDRLNCFAKYYKGAIENPAVVGAHYFRWQDQPTTGRTHDGENHSVGLIDICDTPIYDMINSFRNVAGSLYQTRLKASVNKK